MRRGLRIATVYCLAAALLLLGACESFSSPLQEDVAPQVLQPAIDPLEGAVYARQSVRLYFRLAGEGLLAYEDRQVEVTANERLEATALRELIAGPRGENTELKPLINPQTRVLTVNEKDGILEVGLSREFMEPAEAMPTNWREEHPSLREEYYLQRRLAVYSVVNTLTSLGVYSRVLIMVDQQNSGQLKRIRRGSMGFLDADAEQYMEAMGYEGSVVLTPQHMMETVAEGLIQSDWARVYRFLSAEDETGARPLLQDVSAMLRDAVLRIDHFEAHDETVSSDGKSAVVFIDIALQRPDGQTLERSNIPVRLVREGAVLRMDYATLKRLLEVESS